MPLSLVDFVTDFTRYRFTVSVMAREVRRTGIEIDWKGQWDNIQVLSMPRQTPALEAEMRDRRIAEIRRERSDIAAEIQAAERRGAASEEILDLRQRALQLWRELRTLEG
jgi:hypothetical protein